MPGPFDQGWTTIVVAASGPSLSDEQAKQVEQAREAGRCRVLAVGRTGLTLLPNADALYAADRCFWVEYLPDVREKFSGQLWTQDAASAKEFGLHKLGLARKGYFLLREKYDAVNHGGNSGFQALGLAYLFGARRIVLVGFDMQRAVGKDGRRDGQCHHYGDHRGKLHNAPPAAFGDWAPRFKFLAADLKTEGVDVVNCTIDTALTCFPRSTLEEVFP